MLTAYSLVPSPNHIYPDHPESPERLVLLEPRLDTFEAERLEAVPATPEQIATVHDRKMISSLEEICHQGAGIIDYAPTYVTETSFADALLAAGGTITCTRAVLTAAAGNAFAIVRPPGHHAEPERAMGFCIFNNVAIGVREALATGLESVMVVDYDAHHGNGTQAAFLNEDRVAYISMHQWGIYPGSGWIEDAPRAKKRIINVPLPARSGDQVYARLMDQILRPAIESFRPQMLFVSAGFDAHWSDPLTSLGLSTAGYFAISKRLVEFAEEFSDGKIVFVLEGGYDPQNVANGASAIFSALTHKEFVDLGDPSPYREPDASQRIEQIRAWHGFQ
jgi:acetoin utilization deacetylase AcuC-like enzyme